jgi:hypothetical protein
MVAETGRTPSEFFKSTEYLGVGPSAEPPEHE